MNLEKKKLLQLKRCFRVRKKVFGTPEKPRLAVSFSNKHIYAQCIDDTVGHTLVFLSTLGAPEGEGALASNTKSAALLAKLFANQAQSKGINRVVFDRRGRRFHGCVKVFADVARQNGLVF